MTEAEVKPSRRVILVVDACSDARALVDLAVELTVEMTAQGDTHLHGLFIEDEDLLSVADLPCSEEISQHTALPRSTSRELMSDRLRRKSQHFQRYLEQEAGALQLSWSIDYRSARASDPVVLIESSAICHIVAKPSLRRVPSARPRTRRIVVLESRSAFMSQVLQTVIRPLQQQRLEVVLIKPDATDADQPEGPGVLPMLQLLQQELPLLAVKSYARASLADLLAAAPACDYVILSKDEADAVIKAVFRRLGCPVLLVD